jgi:hypothetical protein
MEPYWLYNYNQLQGTLFMETFFMAIRQKYIKEMNVNNLSQNYD